MFLGTLFLSQLIVTFVVILGCHFLVLWYSLFLKTKDFRKCEPSNTSKPSLCSKQLIDTSTFRSYQTQQLYTIFHKLNCKSKFIIHLMECAFCKVQYVGKAEIAFNIRLNNLRKNVNNPKSIPAPIQSACKIYINRTSK